VSEPGHHVPSKYGSPTNSDAEQHRLATFNQQDKTSGSLSLVDTAAAQLIANPTNLPTSFSSDQQIMNENQDNQSPVEPQWTNEAMIIQQKGDVDINFIRRALEASDTKPTWKDIEGKSADTKTLWMEWDRLQLKNGVLCRKWSSIDRSMPDICQVVLPRPYRADLITKVHSGVTGGHLGRRKTEEQVRRRAYWPRWKVQVDDELKRCAQCASYHRGKAPRQQRLQPMLAGEPFEVVGIDITGKHPKSAR